MSMMEILIMIINVISGSNGLNIRKMAVGICRGKIVQWFGCLYDAVVVFFISVRDFNGFTGITACRV
jgi:hypothetical protein